mgnify:CR=1 FL=1
MNAVRWWQRAAGLLMVLFLLTVGWKMRAFIWTAVQNAVVRSWYPVWGTNLRDIPDSEEGKRHRLAGWKKQTQGEADPSYYKYLEEQEVRQEYMDFLAQFSGSRLVDGTLLGKWNGLVHESGRQGGGETDEERLYSAGKNGEKTERANTAALVDSPRLRKKLEDYDYLIQHFFTIHPTASIDRSLMNAETFLSMDLTIRKDEADGPQILIYHTHSQETFADSRPGERADTVIGLGDDLQELLEKQYGYEVLHITEAFDMKEGCLERSRAYNYAEPVIAAALEEHPSIQVVIDLHRDGVNGSKRLVTEINGKPTAQIMFFNGLSRTKESGELTSLPNPYQAENLAFSFQMEYEAKQYYPGFSRCIYLKGYRYNLHLRPRSVLLEVGAQTNTVEEVKNAMGPFSDILHKVLSGKSPASGG